jgi:hypothetical protein
MVLVLPLAGNIAKPRNPAILYSEVPFLIPQKKVENYFMSEYPLCNQGKRNVNLYRCQKYCIKN